MDTGPKQVHIASMNLYRLSQAVESSLNYATRMEGILVLENFIGGQFRPTKTDNVIER